MKYKYNNKLTLLIFFDLVLISPWAWIFLIFLKSVLTYKGVLISDRINLIIDEINILRGELLNSPLSLLSYLVANKPIIFGRELMVRYLALFDTHFLFFEGLKATPLSNQNFGLMPLGSLPFILIGLYKKINSRARNVYLALLILSPLPSLIFFYKRDYLSAVPLVIFLTYTAAIGFKTLYDKKPRLTILLLSLMFIEFIRFQHDLYSHYLVP